MNKLNRRSFLKLTTSSAIATIAADESHLLANVDQPLGGQTEAGDGVSRRLAHYLVSARPEDIPAAVRKEAARTLVNFMGVTVGGSRHESVEMALAAITPFAGTGHAQVIGRRERLDIMHATLVNGISSHVLNFDDTHLKTIIHASSTIVPPTLALAEYRPEVTGRDFLHAVVLGMETAFRLGNAVYPNHFDAGWHITGTAGAIGAAVASGRLIGLSEQQMIWAIGLAASQPVGLRESFGSMNKSFNPGRAGQNGLLAALLAARNFTSSDQMLEAKNGWARTLSTKRDFGEITDGLGVRFETALNTYLPFACAIILHPAIDGCVRLRSEHTPKTDDIAAIELHVHPRVLELAGRKTPGTGLEGKFSAYHAAAVASLAGKAGPREFSDDAVRSPQTIALRNRVSVVVDSAITETQARVTMVLKDGRKLQTFVAQVVGSVENPMSDMALTAKAADLIEGVLPVEQMRDLIDACWKVETLPRASTLAKLGAMR